MHQKKPAPWLYLFGTLIWTWFFFGLASFTGQFWLEFPTALLSLVGALGPAIIAIVLISLGYWNRVLNSSALNFLKRCLNPKTLSLIWYIKILGLIVILVFLPVLMEYILTSQNNLIKAGPGAFLLVGLIIGALEEIGWRGYGQEALQRQVPVATSGLIIGIFWAAWHLPLFFIEGTYQYGLGFMTIEFWEFNILIVISSPLYSWLYNAADKVIFAPLIFHGLGNVGQEIVPEVSYFTSIAFHVGLVFAVTVFSWEWMKQKSTL